MSKISPEARQELVTTAVERYQRARRPRRDGSWCGHLNGMGTWSRTREYARSSWRSAPLRPRGGAMVSSECVGGGSGRARRSTRGGLVRAG